MTNCGDAEMGKRGPKPQFGEALTGAQRQGRYARGQQARVKRERALLTRLRIKLVEVVATIQQGEAARGAGVLMALIEEIELALNSSH
jgi:hypothetical protein